MSTTGKGRATEFMARVVLRATVSPSEDPAKVKAALENVVGGASRATVGPESAELVSEDPVALSRIRDQLRDRHVRAAARKKLIANSEGHSAFVLLNRQAAAAGLVALCDSPEESPLGPIHLELHSDRVYDAIDWLTAYPGG